MLYSPIFHEGVMERLTKRMFPLALSHAAKQFDDGELHHATHRLIQWNLGKQGRR
jgi:hypothetical protein